MSIPWYRKLLPALAPRSAVDLQAQAAAAGPEAQNNLGILFASTSEFPQDHAKAAECFQHAANRGYDARVADEFRKTQDGLLEFMVLPLLATERAIPRL